MKVLNHPCKTNVVVYALIRMTIGSVSHIDETKKDLVRDVHRLVRLGVWLENSPNDGFMVYYNCESSTVDKVKSKQHLDQALIKLKESVLGRLNESFS